MLNDDPAKARFYTDDVHNFWYAYDKALKDTVHFKSIFKKHYFDKASRGMNDYMSLKVSSIDAFIAHIKSAPKFYAAIKQKTPLVDDYKKDFLQAFTQLKVLYPPSKFPDVYFCIGAFSSAGTVSDAGLLIGLNQICDADGVPTDELGFRLKTRMNKLEYLPNIISHELVHYQQDGMQNDTTTLSYVIREGMADFIGELISGRVANPALFEWAKGKEKTIWQKFVPDMYFDRYNNWIANSQQATPDNLPDQGYWIGYQICRAYYENATDKKQAISDMLNIKDYKAFLQKSGWEARLAAMP
ncbi:gliding motility protein GldB-related protein [Ferruginibacter sp.]